MCIYIFGGNTKHTCALGVQYVAVRPPPGLPLCGLNPAAAFRLPAVSDSGGNFCKLAPSGA